MSLILNGTTGISDVDGTAAAPALTGTDTNTGIFFPAADTIAFAEGGAEAMRIDASGNVGIGTSSPDCRLMLQTPSGTACQLNLSQSAVTNYRLSIPASTDALTFVYGASTERMRIDTSGKLLINQTSANGSSQVQLIVPSGGSGHLVQIGNNGNNGMNFLNAGGAASVGTIVINVASTAYNTSSDYRLKEAIAPMTGALAKVALLKPCTYKWKVDGSDGQGFIAHELDEVVKGCVTGAKDAVEEEQYEVTPAVKDDEGNIVTEAVMGTRTVPVYQGIDTSFLVATLTAAIQEQQALITALTTRITALEGVA